MICFKIIPQHIPKCNDSLWKIMFPGSQWDPGCNWKVWASKLTQNDTKKPPNGTFALGELRKGPAKGPGKGPAKGPPAETTEPGAEILVIFLMDGLNIWWDLWWVFDKRYPWMLKDLLGWIPFLLFLALTKSLDQMSFYHEDLWLFVFLVRVFQTWYFDVIFPNDMSWVRKMIVHHRTVANKRLSVCPLFTTCDFNIPSSCIGSWWHEWLPLMFPLQSPNFQRKHGRLNEGQSVDVFAGSNCFRWVREFRVFIQI